MDIFQQNLKFNPVEDQPLKKIIHVDMDAFYASVEEKDNPEYRGKALVIGGNPDGRGVVCTANYEARKFGVHSAMATSRAKKLCGHAIFIRPRFSRYSEISKQIKEVFHSYTDLVQPLSLDEAFLDVTDCDKAPTATEIAMMIRKDILDVTGLTASAGVAPNKMLAKIASDINKPNGICVVKPHQVLDFVTNLEVKKIPGIGPVASRKLQSIGIRLCSDVWDADFSLIEEKLGQRFARWILPISKGVDHRKVSNDGVRKSFSIERTYSEDIGDIELIKEKIIGIAENLSQQLKKAEVKGKTINLKLRYHDFKTITRAKSVAFFTFDEALILETVLELFHKSYEVGKPVRLLGVGLSKLDTEKPSTEAGWIQPELFESL